MRRSDLRCTAVLLAALALAACGSTGGVQPLTGADSGASTPPPGGPPPGGGGTPPPSAPPPANRAPTITLPAKVEVIAGTPVNVTPTASDPDGQRLTFSVTNKPAWLAFDPTTGAISGTPTAADVGTYQRVRVTASDGMAEASAQFDITVGVVASGRATLSWVAPTERTDGSPLVDLAGFRVYFGTNQNDLRQVVQIPNPGANSWVIENLTAGTWFFTATAYDAAGAESARSNMASKTIG